MKKIFKLAAVALIGFASFPAYAQEEKTSGVLPPVETPALEEADADYTPVENGYDGLDSGFTLDRKTEIINDNERFWRHNNKLFSIGYSTGSFDLGKYNGGKLTSRWGVGIKGGRNIMVHPRPIAHLVKFGIFVGVEVNYLNFKKGHGSLSGIMGSDYDDYYDDDYNYDDDDYVSLGTHYLTAGLAIGPTATVMPFYWCANPNVARIKVRPFFHVVPSYSALVVSDEDEAEIHGAFACLFSGGFELIWRKLSVGFEWKGGRARYKSLIGDLMGDEDFNDNLWVGTGDSGKKQPRYGCKMFTVSIGVEF